jgi:toxin-antitoxin system PIN domain toxin
VNVLIALFWPAHKAHNHAMRWFARNSRHGWATCPFTQAGFVRVVSNPAFSPDAVSPEEATQLLGLSLKHSTHRFWEATISYVGAVEEFGSRLVGHRQVTDAYLLGLAMHYGGKLATLDKATQALLPPGQGSHSFIEFLSE